MPEEIVQEVSEEVPEGDVSTEVAPEQTEEVTTLQNVLPEEMQGENLPKSLKDFADVIIPKGDEDFTKKIGSLAKAYADTKKMVGGMIKFPGEDATEEEIAAFRGKLGIPATIEDYNIEPPMLNEEEAVFSKESVGAFVEFGHQKGLSNAHVQEVINFQAEVIKADHDAINKMAQEGMEALKKEYGDKYPEKKAGAEKMFAHYAEKANVSPEDMQFITSVIGNRKGFTQFMVGVYEATKDAGYAKGLDKGSGVTTLDSIKQQIKELKLNRHNTPDWGDKLEDLIRQEQKATNTYVEDPFANNG